MLNVAGVAHQAMRHSEIKLTMKNYADSNQIDVAGANRPISLTGRRCESAKLCLEFAANEANSC